MLSYQYMLRQTEWICLGKCLAACLLTAALNVLKLRSVSLCEALYLFYDIFLNLGPSFVSSINQPICFTSSLISSAFRQFPSFLYSWRCSVKRSNSSGIVSLVLGQKMKLKILSICFKNSRVSFVGLPDLINRKITAMAFGALKSSSIASSKSFRILGSPTSSLIL